MLKRISLLLLVILLIFAFTVTAYAGPADSLKESSTSGTRMTYILSYYCNLDISGGGLSTSSANLYAYPGTDRVRISLYLQQYNGGWNTLKHWVAEENGTYVSLCKNWYVMSGYNYRVLVYYYAYEGDDSESLCRTNEEWY